MAHGVLNTEHLQDVPVTITPIDVSGETWDVVTASAILIVLDTLDFDVTDDGVRVDAGQQYQKNHRSVKGDYNASFTIKAQKDDFEAGKLNKLMDQYWYFQIDCIQGGESQTWWVRRQRWGRTHSEDNASMFRFEGEQSYP